MVGEDDDTQAAHDPALDPAARSGRGATPPGAAPGSGAEEERRALSLEPPRLFGRKKKKAPPPSAPEAVVEAPPARAPEPTQPLPTRPAPAPARPVEPAATRPPATPPVTPPALSPAPAAEPSAPATPAAPAVPRDPWLTGIAAALVTGLLVGALVVGGTAGSQQLCTAVRGTSTCGGPGVFLLLAVLVLGVLLGTALLRAADVPDAGSTSLLAVGLLSVVTLLFLVGHLFEWWMALVIPVVAVLTYAASWWITATYVDTSSGGGDDEPGRSGSGDSRPRTHDVR